MLEIIDTPHGKFTNNEETGQTAQQVYEQFLADNFDIVDGEYVRKQIDICSEKPKTLEEQVKDLQKEKEQLWETVQFLLKKTGMIGDEKNATD